MSKVFSGHIKANDGFASPTAFDGPPGWTVYKSQQTEIYKITHNLHLTNPNKQLHITALPQALGVQIVLEQSSTDSFTFSAWKIIGTNGPPAPAQTDFAFVAVYYHHS